MKHTVYSAALLLGVILFSSVDAFARAQSAEPRSEFLLAQAETSPSAAGREADKSINHATNEAHQTYSLNGH